MKRLHFILIYTIIFNFFINILNAQGDNCLSAVQILSSGTYTSDGPSTGGGATNFDAANADWYYGIERRSIV